MLEPKHALINGTPRAGPRRTARWAEQRYRVLIEDAPVMYVITRSRRGGPIIEDCNQLFASTLGYRRDEVLGQPLANFYTSGSRTRLENGGYRRALAGRFVAQERDLVTRDGEIIHTLLRAVPDRDARGRVRGTRAMYIDITDRKLAEEALRRSEQRYRSLFEGVPEVVYTLNRDGRIGLLNPAFEQVTGWPVEAWIGRSFLDLIHPADRRPVRREFERILRGHTHPFRPVRVLTRWGETRVLEVVGVARREDEGITGVTGYAHDVTARVRAEEDLRRRLAELEAVARISVVLRTAQTSNEMLHTLLGETLAALGTDAGVIWLYHADNDALQVAAARGWFEQLRELPLRPGEGIAGTVFATGQPHTSREFAGDPLVRGPAMEAIPAGWGGICVPIRTASEVVGVVFVSVRLPREISPQEVTLLVSLAEIAGTALHRVRLHEETVRHLRHLQALQTVGRALSASLDLNSTLSTLLEQVCAHLDVDAAGVLLLNPHSLVLEYAAGWGFSTRSYERSRLPLGEGVTGRAAMERQLVQVSDVFEDPDLRRAGLFRAEGFRSFTAIPLLAKGELKGMLEVFRRSIGPSGGQGMDFLETLARQAALAITDSQLFDGLQRSNAELRLAYDTTIEGWSRALDLRDRETEGHTQRVTEMTLKLARAAGMTEEELVHLRRGALLHDIGKMGIPDTILFKPGPLTEEEWAIMRTHPTLARNMLAPIPYLHAALDIPYAHHERWDGTGYPRGLAAEEIPLAARLFAAVDVWDALRSDRPYRRAWPESQALAYIRSHAGTHFDPRAVELFLRVVLGAIPSDE